MALKDQNVTSRPPRALKTCCLCWLMLMHEIPNFLAHSHSNLGANLIMERACDGTHSRDNSENQSSQSVCCVLITFVLTKELS